MLPFSVASAGDDGRHVLIVSHDQQALFVPSFVIAEEQNLNGQQLEQLIRETVDVHAEAGVDIVSLCFFARDSLVIFINVSKSISTLPPRVAPSHPGSVLRFGFYVPKLQKKVRPHED